MAMVEQPRSTAAMERRATAPAPKGEKRPVTPPRSEKRLMSPQPAPQPR
jgi:hypothetical protein